MSNPGRLAPHRRAVQRRAVVVLALIVAGGVWAAWSSWLRSVSRSSSRDDGPRDVYAGTPYRNARPDVEYVGDAACAECHVEIAEAYRSHPMGRSLDTVEGLEGVSSTAAKGGSYDAQGLHYTVERRDGRTFHKATRRGIEGEVLAENEAEVRYALGSGTRGVSFLIDRDGFLFLSPIAWFAQGDRWGTSPGFDERAQQSNFERPVYPDCLFCHANRVAPVPGPMNRYEEPIFRGHAIGCERCHGPGALHVEQKGQSDGPDLTIVNPAKLAPALRDSVCQQCHLQGTFRTPRAGREPFDFRPGLPMHRFFGVFQMKEGNREQYEAIGHVEQMESSRCHRESSGTLGCISCHDPHRLPEPAAKAAYYRERCMSCHEKKGCALPPAERRARGQGEDCIACHMPRMGIENIPHTAATDHRIRRDPSRGDQQSPRRDPRRPDESPLVDHHWTQMTEGERQDAGRELGIASAWVAQRLSASPPLAKAAATHALPSLEAAVRDRPDDLPAVSSLGIALELAGRVEDSLNAFESALRIEPNHELSLRHAGRLQGILRRDAPSCETARKTIAVNPWRSDYRLALARFTAQAGDWAGAVAACREAIRLNPDWLDARSFLVECLVHADEPKAADAEFQVMLRFYPASRDAWMEWYERLKSPR